MKLVIVIFLIAVGLWLIWTAFNMDAVVTIMAVVASVIVLSAMEWWER